MSTRADRDVPKPAVRRGWAAARISAAAVSVFAAISLAPVANADPPDPPGIQYQDFYTPPDPLPPGKPGDLIRSEPSRLVLEPSGQLGAFVADGTRIMYRSTGPLGQPTAVTGTYFEPHNPWPGQGPRPLISYATGMYGLGDQCAPSRIFNQGIHFSSGLDIMPGYEETFIATMVARGFAIVVTDYEGVGTPAPAPFMNRISQGNVMIDAARAAMQLPNTSLEPGGPVAFWGWSQGGAASASAAELAPLYGPELNLVGAWVGGPPADLSLLGPFGDGGLLQGALGYMINGLIAAYPPAEAQVMPVLSIYGVDLVNRTRNQCIMETALTFGFHHTSEYFVVDPALVFDNPDFKAVLGLQRVGTLKPEAPVFIESNRWDPVMPWHGARQLAVDWCAKGADVEFWTNYMHPFQNKMGTNHLLSYFVDGERSMQWVADRFNGLPTTPNCDAIPPVE
ncbi:lipase family protein [Mycolicibacterium mageritense]|uniref:Inactive lipase n=1 Tax=Mycolicibacterium mageritense TaxID=53462 RepID=A0AAI8TQ48_MYCME|nr:putative inactive lipase [Mycolicibacterium mageritense]CDO25153.1 lipase [Mycolicibacterium mageritense DSM 44476 = CIP 104973]